MAVTVPVTYTILLSDAAAIAGYQATYPTGALIPPATAATLFGAPIGGQTPGGALTLPAITIPYPGFSISNLSGGLTAESGTILGTGYTDSFGNVYPPEQYYWVGQFLYQPVQPVVPPVQPPPPPTGGCPTGQHRDPITGLCVPNVITPPPNPIGVRRFIDGFETPVTGAGGSGGLHVSRDASRTPDGMGYEYRAVSNENTTHTLSPQPTFSCERFYLRLRKLPVGGNDMVWYCTGNSEANPTLHLDITPAGVPVLYHQGGGAAPGWIAAQDVAMSLGVWYRIDLTFRYKDTPNQRLSIHVVPPNTDATNYIGGDFSALINGVPFATHGSIDYSGVILDGDPGPTQPYGLNILNQTHASSSIGNKLGATWGLECDIDDWIDAAPILNSALTGLISGIDPAIGSHVVLVRPTGLAAGSSAAWVGDWRQLLPIPADASSASDAVVSSTGNTSLVVNTDYVELQLGCAALVVGAFVDGTGTGQLGFTINGAPTRQNVSLFPATWVTSLYTVPTGSTVTVPLAPLGLNFVKDAGAGATSLWGLQASAEMLGFFGPEDTPPTGVTVTVPSAVGTHNAPYFNASTNLAGVTPGGSAVAVLSGVYTGNSFGQDIITTIPAHWWWVRPLSGDSAGVWWWSSVLSATGRRASAMKPIRMPQALMDSGGQIGTMRVAGHDVQGNASGTGYQWIAVCDPSHRFVLNGAFAHATGLASAINPLVDPAFLPDAAFLDVDTIGGTASNWFKGVGHTGTTASKVDAAVSATVAALASGQLTSYAAVHNGNNIPQTAYSVWRRQDGLGSASRICDFQTYTGNGAGGTRDIPVVLNGQTPIFALVTPHNGASIFRDPSHTGVTSSNIAGSIDAATGITAFGVDKITVGTDLNAGGVVYDVFVLTGFPSTLPPPPTNCPVITLAPTALPAGRIGTAYSQAITASGSGSTPYTYQISAVPGGRRPLTDALPAGLTLSSGGTLSGTPSVQGTWTFTVRATDTLGCYGERQYVLTIGDFVPPTGGCPAIAVAPGSLPDGVLYTAYTPQTVSASGGAAPYQYTVSSGSLPPGMTLGLATGIVSGTPTMAEATTFTVKATDANGCHGAQAYAIHIASTGICPIITFTPAPPNGTVGVLYSQVLTPSGGTGPYTFAVTLGSLPPGLTLTTGGTLAGTPTVAGSYLPVIRVTDANGCYSDHHTPITIVTGVTPPPRVCPTITLAPSALPSGVINIAYSQAIVASGSPATPYVYAVSAGALPPGITLTPSGTLAGTPTTAQSSTFTITATDTNGCPGSRQYTLNVTSGGVCPAITVSPLPPPGSVGVAYAQVLTPGGGAAPYTFSVPSGALPPGLTLSSGGTLSGTPSTAGTFAAVLRATDTNGCLGEVSVTITIGSSVGPCPTLGDAIVDLTARLGEVSPTRWTTPELARYLVEALRTWQAFTQVQRGQASFLTQSGVAFYDIPTVVPALRAQTVLDQDLVTDIEYALMEPPTPSVWTGSEQFALSDLTQALQSRLDRFLKETGIVLTHITTAVTPPASGRVSIPANTIAVRRTAWIMANGTVVPLLRDNEWNLNAFARGWLATAVPTAAVPNVYSVSLTPPLTLQLAPVPSVAGTLDLVLATTGPTLDPTVGVKVLIPDDWAWVVKWGALADLLDRAGLAHDPARAAYCQSRWLQGLELVKQAAVVLDARISSAVAPVGTVEESDRYQTTWQTTPGIPTAVLLAGHTMLALSPPPDANAGANYIVTLDVVRNHPVPNLTDFNACIGVDWSTLDDILDLAQHIAMFKEGPDQLEQSMALFNRFQRSAGIEKRLDLATFDQRKASFGQTQQSERIVPRIAPPDEEPS